LVISVLGSAPAFIVAAVAIGESLELVSAADGEALIGAGLPWLA
jgi:hypothetical protein